MSSAAAQKSPEPTMEEILASIRRIISDDAATPTPPARIERTLDPEPEPARDVAPDREDLRATIEREVLELGDPLGDDVADDELEFRPLATTGMRDAPHREAPSAPGPAPSSMTMRRPLAPPSQDPAPRPLLASTTDEAVSRAFNTLAHTVLAENARTLEDVVREMLRPMLKSWLDDNLPTLVERLVRAEIERVARGGR